ncbi:aminoglycoside phosphotransferase family protein [Plantactinospora solaniradicis]|uniref:Aminoglycoside phosphotransferase family protein n=1 Tax=Plantactinospora solaniradicis TaxID=1723736 RepID=A0ABW1KF51_9ACTN
MLDATTALHQEGVLPDRKMHADEIDISVDTVARLIAGQFPHWAGLPLRRVPSTGTVNALFRLGPDLVVRLCRVPWAAGDEAEEQRWLRQLAPYLPVAIPAPVAVGQPTDEYPWTWSILRWLPGSNPVPGNLTAPANLTDDLAEFVSAFRAIDIPDGPRAYRGGPLARMDGQTRGAIAGLKGTIDTDTATAIWDEALDIPSWDGPPTWVHADLLPGNILTLDGRLSAVIDFATVGIGDPACDLIVAWTVLPASVRRAFRSRVGCDEAIWARARARALSISLGGLHYYRDIEPTLAAEAKYTIDEVMADSSAS